ncbi:MAG TPA: hypothetical protein VNX60_10690 [Candidatus Acidoferrum sp.]|nr:hypothetical protein [Candidatus Acidoferrum sp.]
MTLQIKNTDEVSCGAGGRIPITEVRDFFRRIVSHHHDSFGLPDLREQFSLSQKSARALASNLVAQGYVEAQNSALEYPLTEKGRALVRSSAAGKVSRSTAEDALSGLLKRVEQYNLDADKIFTIETVVVFGSFLGFGDKLGDLDVAMKKRDRNLKDPDRAQTALAYARQSGRNFSSFFDELAWADREVSLFLKARKRTISILDWDQFLRMACANPERIPYKVVFGSPEEVAAEIRSRGSK